MRRADLELIACDAEAEGRTREAATIRAEAETLAVEVRLGDCIAGMRALADKSCDVTITDPPYEAEAHTKGRRVKVTEREVVSAELPFAAITETEREVASAASRAAGCSCFARSRRQRFGRARSSPAAFSTSAP